MSDESANATCGEKPGACPRDGQARDDYAQRSCQGKAHNEPEGIFVPVTDAIRDLARNQAERRCHEFLRRVEYQRQMFRSSQGHPSVSPSRILISLRTFERFQMDFEACNFMRVSRNSIMGMNVLRVLDTDEEIIVCLP